MYSDCGIEVTSPILVDGSESDCFLWGFLCAEGVGGRFTTEPFAESIPAIPVELGYLPLYSCCYCMWNCLKLQRERYCHDYLRPNGGNSALFSDNPSVLTLLRPRHRLD